MPTHPIRSALRAVFLAPLTVYRRVVSPLIAPRCRYYPSCSSYAQQAVREYGVARGSVLAAWRLVRCNPMSDGGFDYVEDQKLFKPAHRCAGHDHAHGTKAAGS